MKQPSPPTPDSAEPTPAAQRAFALRPIRPDDATKLMAFVRGLSFGARYFRYGRGDYEITDEAVGGICAPDPDKCLHFVALASEQGLESIVGSARIVFSAGIPVGELAISVSDEWQARGVGTGLMDALTDGARRRGLEIIQARILGTNTGMMEFMRRRGFTIEDSIEGDWLKVATIHV